MNPNPSELLDQGPPMPLKPLKPHAPNSAEPSTLLTPKPSALNSQNPEPCKPTKPKPCQRQNPQTFNRPHPWGLLITFIELIKNRRYNFWSLGSLGRLPGFGASGSRNLWGLGCELEGSAQVLIGLRLFYVVLIGPRLFVFEM